MRKNSVTVNNKRLIIIIAIIAVIVICGLIIGYYFYSRGSAPLPNGPGRPGIGDPNPTDPNPTDPNPADTGELKIHFLELGNKYTGDSVYIQYGDVDILIDAGSRTSSAATIISYINSHMSDGKLEYVIATHAHQDHIAGFYGTGSGASRKPGIFEAFDTGMIIDFPKTGSSSATYNNYIAARNDEISKGAKHYNALQCYKETDGASRKYSIGDDAEIEILYNYYYDHSTGDENDYSVCIMINHGGRHYLFTGDLEKSGEDKLVDYYALNHGGLPHCDVYKGGHHGSNTSSNIKLMAAITPEYVCVCTCAGTDEYGANPENIFPSQAFVDRVAPYTDKVYITTLILDYSAGIYGSMNGNIVLIISAGGITVACSNNNTKLKDTQWFKDNRATPSYWRG